MSLDDARLLPRFFRHQERAEDQARIAQRLVESGEEVPVETRKGQATLPGDRRKLRGVPFFGVGGTIDGSDPLGALLDKEQDRRPREVRIKRNPRLSAAVSVTLPDSPSRDC